MDDLKVLQERTGYTFRDISLLKMAMTHRSFSAHHNERLEFLGDSLLNCVTAVRLYKRFATLNEGTLSRLRSSLVKQQALHEIALKLDLSHFLLLGEGELKTGGANRPSILADAVEALFGAIFLDSDFVTVQQVIDNLFVEMMKRVDPETFGKDAKTQLQEFLQGHKLALPDYNVVAVHGAAHNQQFELECTITKYDLHTFGIGSSRRAAEQLAAQSALEKIQSLIQQHQSIHGKHKSTQSKHKKDVLVVHKHTKK